MASPRPVSIRSRAGRVKSDESAWVAANPDHPDDCPGMTSLPPEARILATFDVPPGVYQDARPCAR